MNDTEREAFEAYILTERGTAYLKRDDDEYSDPFVQEAWEAWQARAKFVPKQADVPGLITTLEQLRQGWSHNVNFEATIGACKDEIVRCVSRAAESASSAQLACGKYTRPKGVMGGPCLTCGRSQPEHVRRETP